MFKAFWLSDTNWLSFIKIGLCCFLSRLFHTMFYCFNCSKGSILWSKMFSLILTISSRYLDCCTIANLVCLIWICAMMLVKSCSWQTILKFWPNVYLNVSDIKNANSVYTILYSNWLRLSISTIISVTASSDWMDDLATVVDWPYGHLGNAR